jgi:hypothetical protein
MLNTQQNKVLSTPTSAIKKFVINLTKHVLADSEEAILMMGLNSSVGSPRCNLDMAHAVELVVLELPQILVMEFRWKTPSVLEKAKSSSMPNITKMDLRAVKSLRLNKDTRIL